ncbi:hypothetical protein O6P43_029060, partial [Quillaja saponaria]
IHNNQKMHSIKKKMEEYCQGHKSTNNYGAMPMSPRLPSRPACTCSNRPGSVQCMRHGYALPGERFRRNNTSNKEVLRRALTPPTRPLSLRWWNFQPSPSRLSNMSVA